MIFKVVIRTFETIQEIHTWLAVNFLDTDYTLIPWHGWLTIDIPDENLATMFKIAWGATVEHVPFKLHQ
jgi:hypothetical protein